MLFLARILNFLGPNKRVDLIFQESGRPDSRAEKKVPPPMYKKTQAPQIKT